MWTNNSSQAFVSVSSQCPSTRFSSGKTITSEIFTILANIGGMNTLRYNCRGLGFQQTRMCQPAPRAAFSRVKRNATHRHRGRPFCCLRAGFKNFLENRIQRLAYLTAETFEMHAHKGPYKS